MGKSQKFEILVIGSGITGLSVCHHLQKLGLDKFALVFDPQIETASKQTMGVIAGGTLDNFTRLSHAFGKEFAKELWGFGNDAFDFTKAFCQKNKVESFFKRRLRLVVSEHELNEVETATKEMHAAGLKCELLGKGQFGLFGEGLTARTVAIQDEGERGGFCRVDQLLKVLEKSAEGKIFSAKVLALHFEKNRIRAQLASGDEIESQVVVLGTHLNSAKFLPSISEAFVSVAEQWSAIATHDLRRGRWTDAGVVFSANHGYELGVTLPGKELNFGGGRFLRHLAGIGVDRALVEDKISAFLPKQLAATFSWGAGARIKSSSSGLDCRPCDELPIIGPMFGEDRLLIAGGYMGAGITLGLYAGQCLAELLHSGKCKSLPARLWPRRLRSA